MKPTIDQQNYIQLTGELFEAVQSSGIFEDSKTFPDSCPTSKVEEIVKAYNTAKGRPDFDLERFIFEHFTQHEISLKSHIQNLWSYLYRSEQCISPYSTLIPLPYPYVVPGGRFQEVYYWDSYFICLGLAASHHYDWIENIAANFAYLIEQYGFIPNGNRFYYLSRSQPPFFSCLIEIIENQKGISDVTQYLPYLEKEYSYWTALENADISGKIAHKKVIKLENGDLLNRYWDAKNTPREESYQEDTSVFENYSLTANLSEPRSNLYRHIRSAAESGWDFSSRWLRGPKDSLETIQTTEIAPIDLNCLLYNLENQLARYFQFSHEPDKSEYYEILAKKRKQVIIKYFWNEESGWFFDFNWHEEQQTKVWSLAGVYPLTFKIADSFQAEQVHQKIKTDFLTAGGVVATLHQTGQQWDYPNGWAPLHWAVVKGLLNYGYKDTAREVANRFVAVVNKTYQKTGKIMEKYDVVDPNRSAGGGEYPNQDGFGWTNGVIESFINYFKIDIDFPRFDQA
jgi:alpha,alpha-trehalase